MALLAEAGAAGFSIEDYDPAAGGMDEIGVAAERVAVAVDACRRLTEPMVPRPRREPHSRRHRPRAIRVVACDGACRALPAVLGCSSVPGGVPRSARGTSSSPTGRPVACSSGGRWPRRLSAPVSHGPGSRIALRGRERLGARWSDVTGERRCATGCDRRRGEPVDELGPHDTFGEAALILDAPRNATVTALEPMLLRTLGREPFLAEVTGNRLSKDALDRLVAARSPAAR